MATKPNDPLTAVELEIVAGLDPGFQPRALLARHRVLTLGVPFTFISGRRSRSQQANEGKANPLAAAVGKSKHEIGFAFDFSGPRNQREYLMAGKAIEEIGLESGVFYKNDPDGRERGHVEERGTRAALFTSTALQVMALGAMLGVAVYVLTDDGA